MNEELEHQAEEFEKMALELEEAVKHCRVAAGHFKNGEVPRGCAHAFASLGHIEIANENLRDRAKFHAEKAKVES